MGVSPQQWAATLAAHPLKFKFEGLDGFHESIQEAYANDEYELRKSIEDQERARYEFLEKVLDEGVEDECDELERYFYYLIHSLEISKVSWDDMGRINLIRKYEGEDGTTPDQYRRGIKILEDAAGTGDADHYRCMFTACDQWDWDSEQEFMEEADTEWLLEKFPLEEVYNSAGQCGIPAEEVVFICPSCNQEPHSIDTLNDMGGHFYCGLCGAEHMPDTQDELDLTVEANLNKFADVLGVKLYPFKEPEVADADH